MVLGGWVEPSHVVEVGAHEALDLRGMGLVIGQALLDGGADQRELREVAMMSGTLLHVLPQMLNRIVVRGVRGQLIDAQARGMGGHELLGHRRGMVLCAILDQDNGPVGAGQHRRRSSSRWSETKRAFWYDKPRVRTKAQT